MKTYVNGELKKTVSNAALGSNSDNVFLGKYTSVSQYFLDGAIDDIKIYSRALSDDEIKLIYEMEK